MNEKAWIDNKIAYFLIITAAQYMGLRRLLPNLCYLQRILHYADRGYLLSIKAYKLHKYLRYPFDIGMIGRIINI